MLELPKSFDGIPTLEQLKDFGFTLCNSFFKRDDTPANASVGETLFVVSKDGEIDPLPIYKLDGVPKIVVLEGIRMMFKDEPDLAAYVHVAEAWYVEMNVGDPPVIGRARDSDRRKEAIIVCAVLRNGGKAISIFDIKRRDDGGVESLIENTNSSGPGHVGGELLELFEEEQPELPLQ